MTKIMQFVKGTTVRFALSVFIFLSGVFGCDQDKLMDASPAPETAATVCPWPDAVEDTTAPYISIEWMENQTESTEVTVIISLSEVSEVRVVLEEDGQEIQSDDLRVGGNRGKPPEFSWVFGELVAGRGYVVKVVATDQAGNTSAKHVGVRTNPLLPPPQPVTLPIPILSEVGLSYHTITSRGGVAKVRITNAPEYGVCQMQWQINGGDFWDIGAPFICDAEVLDRGFYYVFEPSTIKARVVYHYGALEIVSNVVTISTSAPEMDLFLMGSASGMIQFQWQVSKSYDFVETYCYSGGHYVSKNVSYPREQIGLVTFSGLQSGREYTCRVNGNKLVDGIYTVESSPIIRIVVP